MDGKSHLAAGVIFAGIGLMVTDAPLQSVAIPLAVGGISALAPDLDHSNSTLTKKVINPIRSILSLSVLLLTMYVAYELYQRQYSLEYIITAAIVGASLLTVLTLYLKPKELLLLSGLLIIGSALFIFEYSVSLMLLGIFVITASRLKHRGLTHSLYYLAFWSLLCFFAQRNLNIDGIWLAGTLGYLSHLLTDDWFTKTKIKWIKAKEVIWFFNKIKKSIAN